jgi:hypothetical protein
LKFVRDEFRFRCGPVETAKFIPNEFQGREFQDAKGRRHADFSRRPGARGALTIAKYGGYFVAGQSARSARVLRFKATCGAKSGSSSARF